MDSPILALLHWRGQESRRYSVHKAEEFQSGAEDAGDSGTAAGFGLYWSPGEAGSNTGEGMLQQQDNELPRARASRLQAHPLLYPSIPLATGRKCSHVAWVFLLQIIPLRKSIAGVPGSLSVSEFQVLSG